VKKAAIANFGGPLPPFELDLGYNDHITSSGALSATTIVVSGGMQF